MRFVRYMGVFVGVLVITAFGIDASDTLRGEGGTMLAGLIGANKAQCPRGMVPVSHVMTVSCVDAYEVAPSAACPRATPQSGLDTQINMAQESCGVVSEPDREPWRFVTRDQAMQLCARAGKRLPTSAEWYALALSVGEKEGACNTASGVLSPSGQYSDCVSADGVYDLVGNVWEWVGDDVRDGVWSEVLLPEEGYVAQVDVAGMPSMVSDTPQDVFGGDYAVTRASGVFGVLRGGYYASRRDAGIYAVHAATAPTSALPGVGFRCVRTTL
jgi:formylglycine-generating enzyme required for sulfatase activity